VLILALQKLRKSRSDPARRSGFRVALLAAVLLWACSASAEPGALPLPPTAWLTDSVGLLSPGARAALNTRLERYEQQSGHQVVVWIGSTTGAQPLAEFAHQTFERWQLGRKKQDDGLLIAVLANDRKIAFEVGYGLEDRVPDATAARIINDVMAPKLKAGDADGALSAGVDATLQAIDGKPFAPDAAQPPATARPGPPPLWQMILFALVGLGFLGLLVTHPSLALTLLYVIGRGGGGGAGGGGFGGGGFGGGGFGGGGGRSGGGGARGSW
jgi:uncharacterized protein